MSEYTKKIQKLQEQLRLDENTEKQKSINENKTLMPNEKEKTEKTTSKTSSFFSSKERINDTKTTDSIDPIAFDDVNYSLRDSANRTIQRHTRKFLNKRGMMSNPSIRQYQQLCNNESTKNMVKSKNGRCAVYFPEFHPDIILKKLRNENTLVVESEKITLLEGKDKSRMRLNKMKKVRRALDRLKCSHLFASNCAKSNNL